MATKKSRPTSKRPPAKPPAVPHPAAAGEKPQQRPPRRKADGRATARAEQLKRLRWALVAVGLVVVLMLLVAVNAFVLRQEGALATPTPVGDSTPAVTEVAPTPGSEGTPAVTGVAPTASP